MSLENKKVVLSGVQPSGKFLTIGNYLGALKNWVSLQENYDSIFLVVDMHALTVKQNPTDLRNRCLSYVAQYIACGIEPEKSTIVIQSHVPQHAELMWVLSTLTYVGELNRMTQFKDKSKRHSANINAGLYTYPVLMASDILLYEADYVPVGSDQKQHLELARDLAIRFNTTYSETFKIPDPYIPKQGAKIMSLQDPLRKMSSSDTNSNNIISILDSPEIIKKKIKKAVTDSGSQIKKDSSNPGITNLLQLHSLVTGINVSQLEKEFEGKLYSDLKNDLIDSINDFLKPIQDEYNQLISNKDYLNSVLKKGADDAFYRARRTLSKVYRKVGFLPK